jgi:hypothetical protein
MRMHDGGVHTPPPTTIRLNQTLDQAVRTFAMRNDITINRAMMHLLTLGLHEMERQYEGSIMRYVTRTPMNQAIN